LAETHARAGAEKAGNAIESSREIEGASPRQTETRPAPPAGKEAAATGVMKSD
jgi:hypothetical protein